MTERKPDLFADAGLDPPPIASDGLELFAFALNLYRTPLQYLAFIGVERPLPAGLEGFLEALNKPEESEVWSRLALRLNCTAGELRTAGFFLVRRLLFADGADNYRVLGLAPGAGDDRIKAHYRLLMALFHPDRNPDGDEWNQLYAPKINDAYNILKNRDRKRRYDRELAFRAGAGAGGGSIGRRWMRGARMGLGLAWAGDGNETGESVLSRHWRPAVWVTVLLLGVLAGIAAVMREAETLKTVADGPAGRSRSPRPAEPGQGLHQQAPEEALGVALARAAGPLTLTRQPAERAPVAETARNGGEGGAQPVTPAADRKAGDGAGDPPAAGQEPAKPAARKAVANGGRAAAAHPAAGGRRPPAPSRADAAGAAPPQEGGGGERGPVPRSAPPERPERPPTEPVSAMPAAVMTPAGERLIAEAQRTTDISQASVDLLLANFIRAYEDGDTVKFANLFDEHAVIDDGMGRAAVVERYDTLFRTSRRRSMAIDRVAWRGEGKRKAIVFGMARVELDGGKEASGGRYLGGMMMRVYKVDDVLKILELHHRMDRQ